MTDIFAQRRETEAAEAERRARRNRQPDDRVVEELRQLRRWTFLGPFWAIIATGAISAVLWILAQLVA